MTTTQHGPTPFKAAAQGVAVVLLLALFISAALYGPPIAAIVVAFPLGVAVCQTTLTLLAVLRARRAA